MTSSRHIQLGDWRVDFHSGELVGADERRELEPQTTKLLRLMIDRAGEVVSKPEISAALWPDTLVSDDALSRTVFKLRQALGDDAKAPRYIETLSKRGYRLIAAVSAIEEPALVRAGRAASLDGGPRFLAAGAAVALLAIAAIMVWIWTSTPDSVIEEEAQRRAAELTRRGDDFYAQFDPQDNESARRLYEQALLLDPDHAPALAGLSNTQIQIALRWPQGEALVIEGSAMGEALQSGRLDEPEIAARIERALGLAQRAVQAAPSSPEGYRALGLARAASGDVGAAIEAYSRAVTLDPDAWESLINLGDMHNLQGESGAALAYFEQAYEAMSRLYADETAQIRPWHSALGLTAARMHDEAGDRVEAERWLRRVLYWDPLNREAVLNLAALLARSGDGQGAREVCSSLPDLGEACPPER